MILGAQYLWFHQKNIFYCLMIQKFNFSAVKWNTFDLHDLHAILYNILVHKSIAYAEYLGGLCTLRIVKLD